MRRPGSLAEVATLANNPRSFHFALADFLDQFRLGQGADMLAEEPARLSGHMEEGAILDAYLAAVAVSLARSISTPPPLWARQDDRKLRRPWFAHPGATLRATLLAESPAAFRERNLFVSANALSRA